MATVKVYQYGKCSTCKKALQFLNKKKLNVEAIDITEKPPTKKELTFMLDQYEGDLRRLFNTSGIQYRELGIKDKIKTMTEKQALDLLSKNGKLIKRPFVIKGNQGLVGFKENEWKEVF